VQPVNWEAGRECGPVFREFTQPVFQAIAGSLVFNRDPVEECHRAFRLFDTDGRGMITVDDLKRVMQEIGQAIEDKELQSMIREFDSDGKGGVNEDEFVKIMLRRRG
jgi:centrin-3